jgi:hypothetical protein
MKLSDLSGSAPASSKIERTAPEQKCPSAPRITNAPQDKFLSIASQYFEINEKVSLSRAFLRVGSLIMIEATGPSCSKIIGKTELSELM